MKKKNYFMGVYSITCQCGIVHHKTQIRQRDYALVLILALIRVTELEAQKKDAEKLEAAKLKEK
jgi:hypothetical protein